MLQFASMNTKICYIFVIILQAAMRQSCSERGYAYFGHFLHCVVPLGKPQAQDFALPALIHTPNLPCCHSTHCWFNGALLINKFFT